MKYIKTFEELTPHIYTSAAHKLVDILRSTSKSIDAPVASLELSDDDKKSSQYRRAINLSQWSIIPDKYKKFGIFNININKDYDDRQYKINTFYINNFNFEITSNNYTNFDHINTIDKISLSTSFHNVPIKDIKVEDALKKGMYIEDKDN